MFSLLRDAFVNNLPVTADFLIDSGKKNGIAIRVALTRNPIVVRPPIALGQGTTGKVMPASSAGGKADATARRARSEPKPRKGR
jgi:hypothetical protein